MGTQYFIFKRYARFIEVPLAVILLGPFIFFGLQYLGQSSYTIHRGDAPLDIQAARGQEVDITIVWGQSINGDWATKGLTLSFDGQNMPIEIVSPQDTIPDTETVPENSSGYKDISIDARFTIPNYSGPVTETLTGTIQGQITSAQDVGGGAFDEATDDVSLPVRLHLIPLMKQAPSYLPAILLILLLGAGTFLRRRLVRIQADRGATMCARCQTKTSMGRLYPFYFGTLLSTHSTRRGNQTIVTKNYKIAGSQQAYACDRCISRGLGAAKISVIVLGGLATLGVLIAALTSLGLTDSEFYFQAAGILFVAIWYVVSLITLHRFRVLQKTSRSSELRSNALQGIGGDMAIAANRGALERQGYNAFFSPPGYRGLNRNQSSKVVAGRATNMPASPIAPTAPPTQVATTPTGFQAFISSDHTLRIAYPGDWQQTTAPSGTGSKFTSQDQQKNLIATNLGISPADPPTLVSAVCSEARGKPSSPQTVNIGGQLWTKVECDVSGGSSHLVAEAVLYKGKLFLITYSSPKESFESNASQCFTPMGHSFQFLS